MQPISSPNENVAQKTLLLVTNATTKIKEVIVKSIQNDLSQEELTKVLNKTIAECCKEIPNLELREETRKALVVSSRKWYYQLSQTVNILNRNLANTVSKWQDGTFTGDINYILNNVNKIRLNAIRPYVDMQVKKGLAVIEDYRSKMNIALKALAAEPPKVVKVEGKKAYTFSLRNRAECTVRYEANIKDLDRLIQNGVEYVWTTSHPDASPRCSPYQGKLYSLNPNNKQGTHNGIPYTYLGDILKKNNGNSIINGYNCRHRLVPYQEGSHAPTEYTQEEIRKEYAIDQKQRYYENNIRQLKTEEQLLRASGELKKAKKLRVQWRRMTKNYEIYSLENKRAFYRWRTVVSDKEEYYKAVVNNSSNNKQEALARIEEINRILESDGKTVFDEYEDDVILIDGKYFTGFTADLTPKLSTSSSQAMPISKMDEFWVRAIGKRFQNYTTEKQWFEGERTIRLQKEKLQQLNTEKANLLKLLNNEQSIEENNKPKNEYYIETSKLTEFKKDKNIEFLSSLELENAIEINPTEQEKVDGLVKGIKENGFTSILMVYVTEDNTKYLITGSHRLAALKQLNAEGYEVNVPIVDVHDVVDKWLARNDATLDDFPYDNLSGVFKGTKYEKYAKRSSEW